MTERKSSRFSVAKFLAVSVSALLLTAAMPSVVEAQNADIRPNQCTGGIYQRREIRALSSQERDDYIAAVKSLQTGSRPTKWDQFATMHYNAAGYAHGNALFFPWHRYFIAQFEKALQTFNPNVTLPYWDWSMDSQAPDTSIVFRSDYFGGNGDANDQCVTDGPFANLRVYTPQAGCLKRDFAQDSMSAFYSPEALQHAITTYSQYLDFHPLIEGTPHASVHNGIAGSMLDMYSPVDPIFFLHHGMIDKIWAQWQIAHPESANTYAGTKEGGGQASPNDVMQPWNTLSVKDMFDTRAFCYTYADLSTDNLNTPTDAGNNTSSGNSSGNQNNNNSNWKGNFKPIKGVKPRNSKNSKNSKNSNGSKGQSKHSRRRRSLARRAGEDTPAQVLSAAAGLTTDLAANTTAAAANATATPGDLADTTSLTKLTMPCPIPDAWIRMNNLNATYIRSVEADFKNNVYDKVNAISGYVSPCALGNRHDQLAQLLAAGVTDFVATSLTDNQPIPVTTTNYTDSGANVVVAATDLAKQAVDAVKAQCTSSGTSLDAVYNPNQVEQQLQSIIGSTSSAGVPQGSALDLCTAAKNNWLDLWQAVPNAVAAVNTLLPALGSTLTTLTGL